MEHITYNKKHTLLTTKKRNLFYVLCYMFYDRSGFTLIEVLVSAAIIGLLSTVGVTGFQVVTRNGRDALRKSDLEQIRSALEIYKSENDQYPAAASDCQPENLTPDYINTYPQDPKSSQYRYCYTRGVSPLTYTLCTHLENGSSTDITDCGNSKCGPADSAICNYKVNNP